MVEFGSAGQAE